MAKKVKDQSDMPRFPLIIVGKDEDVPRSVQATGRHKAIGQVAMVLGMVSTLACIRADGSIGLWQGSGWTPLGAPSKAGKDVAQVVTLIKEAQAATPKAKGPVSLKGTWSGFLTCEVASVGHIPVVVLHRKIAAYAELWLIGRPSGWSWQIKRKETWFASSGDSSGDSTTFLEALKSGLNGALGLVQSACRVRDTTRRQSKDPAYAALHPPHEYPERQIDPARVKAPPAPKAPKAPAAPPEIPAAFASLVQWNNGYWVLTSEGWKAPAAGKAPKGTKPSQKALREMVADTWDLRGKPAGYSMPEAYKPKPPPPRQPSGEPRATKPKAPKAAKAPKGSAPPPPAPPPPPAATENVDAEKDKVLASAVGDAVRAALGL